jgi:hypothetical protein
VRRRRRRQYSRVCLLADSQRVPHAHAPGGEALRNHTTTARTPRRCSSSCCPFLCCALLLDIVDNTQPTIALRATLAKSARRYVHQPQLPIRGAWCLSHRPRVRECLELPDEPPASRERTCSRVAAGMVLHDVDDDLEHLVRKLTFRTKRIPPRWHTT